MTGWHLTLLSEPLQWLDMTDLTKALELKDRDALAKTRVAGHSLGDIFKIEGRQGAQALVQGHVSWRNLGAYWSHGHLIIDGDTGAYVGQSMSGGEITVRGNAGDFAAAAMSGGQLLVEGDAGDGLAAPLSGARQGMTGGTIIVHGNIGMRGAEAMRRGLVVIAGKAGPWLGTAMYAGTVVCAGVAGDGIGYGMRRGSIVLLNNKPKDLGATFADCGRHDLPFFSLLMKAVKDACGERGINFESTSWRRLAGDQALGGRGEVWLVAQD